MPSTTVVNTNSKFLLIVRSRRRSVLKAVEIVEPLQFSSATIYKLPKYSYEENPV